MSFGPAIPKIGRASPERISVAVIASKNGALRLMVSISKTIWQRLNLPQACDVNIGAGEDEGKLRFVFRKEGAYRIFKVSGGGGRMILPLVDGVPEGFSFGATSCDFVSTQIHLVLTLPLAAWAEMAAA